MQPFPDRLLFLRAATPESAFKLLHAGRRNKDKRGGKAFVPANNVSSLNIYIENDIAVCFQL